MLQVKPKMPEQDKVSTKWHTIKERFRYLFKPELHDSLERWYNTVAPQRHREAFREVMKAIHATTPPPDVLGRERLPTSPLAARCKPQPLSDLATHRARHIVHLYSELFTLAGQQHTCQWLVTAPPALTDKFKDVFSSVQVTLQPRSVMKDTFVARPPSEDVHRLNSHKRIDWESGAAAELIRESHSNPMDGNHPGTGLFSSDNLPSVHGHRKNQTFAVLQRAQRPKLDAVLEAELAAAQEAARKAKEEPTLFHPKRRQQHAAESDENRKKIIATFGNSSAGWVSTTREHIRNHGPVQQQRVTADAHPCVARLTASLGMPVPQLRAKPKIPMW